MDRPLSSRKLAAGAVKLKTLRPVGKQPDFVFANQIAGTSNCHVDLLFTCKRTNLVH